MTADQSLFTELLPGKRKAAKGAAVEKGSGKDGNEKDPSCVEVPDEMEVSKSSGRKVKSSSSSASEKRSSDDAGVAKSSVYPNELDSDPSREY